MLHPIFILFYLGFASAWQKYAEELKMSPNVPGNKDLYEFDLVVAHKQTMTRIKDEYNHIEVIDYKPDERAFYGRNHSQLGGCFDDGILLPNALDGNTNSEVLDDLILFDGRHKHIVTINGRSPGKTIVVPYNSEVVMRVKNRLLLEGVSMHLHGLDKKDLWHTDGVAFLQQCPISTGSNFAYRFIADFPGTHWYHGHLMTDRGEGLVGGFVIIKAGETYPNPFGGKRFEFGKIRQYYVLFQDWPVAESAVTWYSQRDRAMKWLYGFDNNKQCWAPTRRYDGSNVGGSVPISTILVNDKGWQSQEDIKSRPSALPLETFRIIEEEEIIFRLVSGTVAQELMITFEDHEMYIIAADGVEIIPKKVDKIVIFSGERYDILLKGKQKAKRKVYPIVIETLEHFNWNWTTRKPYYGLAKLEYEESILKETDEVDWEYSKCSKKSPCLVANCPFAKFPPKFPYACKGLHSHELESANIPKEDQDIIQQKNFTEGFEEHFINMHYDAHVNGWMFKMPRAMPYFNEDNMAQYADWCDPVKCNATANRDTKGCHCFYHLNITLGNIVQLTIYNMGDGGKLGKGYTHPFHIHGTHFYVVKAGYPNYDEDGMVTSMNSDIPCSDMNTKCNGLKWTNPGWLNGNIEGMHKKPSFRDTVVLPVGGYVVLRFRATNPGWFFAHCHLELHTMGGMAFGIKVGTTEEMAKPPSSFPHHCGDYEPESVAHLRRGIVQSIIAKEAIMDESDIRDQPSVVSRFFSSLAIKYQYYLDCLTPFTAVRWAIAISTIIIFCLRIFTIQGFYIVTYALFIYYLNMFLAFLTPRVDPALDFDSEDEDGPVLPKSNNEEFRPFMRRLPEFKFWLSTMKSTLIAFGCTFFEVFDVPVFWPILVMYFFVLFFLTMKRQIMHMIKYRYIPFTVGKPKMHGRDDTGAVVQAI
ncbi:hypothetical protein QR680_003506 [Steinernema hermaphroditum]|uniref:Uncharacterized protein n=1 Tax=Steinernema hermaphroditum TaxID=289476 RepID=A0AA39HMY3_9BILA|nr:hypothetical protein QR680_003506 [Steinernema hermaphroditum]